MTAEEIRELRERLELSRRQLAAQLGVDKRTIERWEQDRGRPNVSARKMLENIEHELG